MGYLANFMVYTLAMVGVIAIALLIFKGATSNVSKKSSKLLNVVDTMSLGPRKTLYIVSAGKEKFLIDGDVDKTLLISISDGLGFLCSINSKPFCNSADSGCATLKSLLPA